MEKPTILVVDDTPSNIRLLSGLLKAEYRVRAATSGPDALAVLAGKELPGLILIDVMMPDMDGYEVCRRIKSDPRTSAIPVIFITARNDVEGESKGFETGAGDYITKPFSLPIVMQRVRTHFQLKRYQDYLEEIVRDKTSQLESEKDHAVFLRHKTEKQLELFLLTLASAIESRDSYTGGHVERVANYTRDIAENYGLDADSVRRIYLAAIVHDVGKIGIRDAVLNKAGRLTPEEFDQIKAHTVIGYKLISNIDDVEVALQVTLSHQEKWDGSGYPQGLGGKAIPLEARMVTIADYWDAIVTDRPYRKAFPLDKALEIMASEREKAFDPGLLDIFLDPRDKIYLKYLKREE